MNPWTPIAAAAALSLGLGAAHADPVSLLGQRVQISQTGVQCWQGGWSCVTLNDQLPDATVGAGYETGSHYLGYASLGMLDIDADNNRIWLSIFDQNFTSYGNWNLHIEFPDLVDAAIDAVPLYYQPFTYVSVNTTFSAHAIDITLNGAPGYTYGWNNIIWSFQADTVQGGGGGTVPEPGSSALVATALWLLSRCAGAPGRARAPRRTRCG